MTKRLVATAALAAVIVMLGACSKVVWMGAHTEGVFEQLPDSVQIQRVDARGMARQELEAIIADHRILARMHERLPAGERREEVLESTLDDAELAARTAGADVLLYMEDSEVMGAIMQDARYSAPPGTIAIYIMRTRGRR